MRALAIDTTYLLDTLVALLNIPSPSGYTDPAVHFVGESLSAMGVDFSVTRRGAIRATIPGRCKGFDRAVSAHLDTLGAMVRRLKPNGRLAVAPIGTWSSRFAEGSRVTVYTDTGPLRGTVLPLKASGHRWGDAVDTHPVGWDQIEIRVDIDGADGGDLYAAGCRVGDIVSFDAVPEILDNGFINARHLDDKAGVAGLLALIHALRAGGVEPEMDSHFIFTVFEEVGSGASEVICGDIAEMVVLDHAPVAEDQHADLFGVTVCMMDQSGPFDYHLSRKLISLCREHGISHARDVFRYYRSDSASAIEAGHDTRTALIGFSVDGSHGYERTHLKSLLAVTELAGRYLQSAPLFQRDREGLASLNGFPRQPSRDAIQIET